MNDSRANGLGLGRGKSEHYAALLSEQERGGQSVRAFALERGLSPLTLYVWRRKLGRARSRSGSAAGGLVAVDVIDRHGVDSGSLTEFEVLLANGTRVRVPRQFDPARLAALMAVLRSC
jgi:transposase-like protein